MSKPLFDLSDNPIQRNFVLGEEVFSAYIGGVGAGKTFGNLLRNLLILGQPRPEGAMEAPRGLIGAESYPVLDDIIIPQWEKIQNQIKHLAPNSPMREVEYIRSKKRAMLKNGARLDFRSLDRPNALRGRELTTFGIDEGRNVPKLAWDRLFDRLRQPLYRRAGFVTSTPNGYDWMYDLFHEDSTERGWDPYTDKPFVWYNASTEANKKHLDEAYMASLRANLSGAMLDQEYYGLFVGTTEGSVYSEWDRNKYLVPLWYDASLPLYSLWDFGIGDLGVCTFIQIKNVEVPLTDSDGRWLGINEYVPHLLVLDSIGQSDLRAKDWAQIYKDWLDLNCNGRQPDGNFGDPAGKQRAQGSGTSVMDDLAAEGVIVAPAPKRAPDYGIRIIKNMIAGGRVLVNKRTDGGKKLSSALSSHRWPLDANGNRTGNKPVHDWTSHYADTLRYGAASLLSFFPRRRSEPPKPPPPPGSIGHIISKLTGSDGDGDYIGPQDSPAGLWVPGSVGLRG